MKRKEDRPISKHTLNLYAGQLDKLQELHPRLGAAKVIRTLVDDHIRSVAEGLNQIAEPLPLPNVAIEEILP
jgi:site-specific recombinase XerC